MKAKKKKRPTPFLDKNSCRLDQKLLNKLKKESTPPPKVWFLPFFYRLLHYTHTHTRNRSWKHIENTTFFFFSSWKSWWIKNWLVTQCPRSAAIIKQQQLFCILYRLLFFFWTCFISRGSGSLHFCFYRVKKKKKRKIFMHIYRRRARLWSCTKGSCTYPLLIDSILKTKTNWMTFQVGFGVWPRAYAFKY